MTLISPNEFRIFFFDKKKISYYDNLPSSLRSKINVVRNTSSHGIKIKGFYSNNKKYKLFVYEINNNISTIILQGFTWNDVVENTFPHGIAYKASKSTVKNYKQSVYVINNLHLPHNNTRRNKNFYTYYHTHINNPKSTEQSLLYFT